MGRTILAQFDEIMNKSKEVHNETEEFNQNLEEIKKLIAELISTDYVSRDASEIGSELEAKLPSLEKIRNKMGEYGDHLASAVNKIVGTIGENINTIRKN